MQRFAGLAAVCGLWCSGCGGRAIDALMEGPSASPPFYGLGGGSGTFSGSPAAGAAAPPGSATAGGATPGGASTGTGGTNAGFGSSAAGSGGAGGSMSAAGSAGAGGFGAAGSASVGSAGAAGAPGFGGASGSTGAALGGALFSEVGSLAAADSPEQLVYAASYSTLLAREVSGRIDVVDLATGQSTARMPTSQFVDMSLSPDGRYLYASDYGGENIGYSTPFSPSYVHRLDLADRSWAVKAAYIAGNIQVTSSDQFVLGTLDQWITFTLSSWGVGLDVTQLNSLYAGVYSGDFRFDPRTQRLIHGNAGLSSQEIQAFEIVDQQIEVREGSGTYGSASGYGPSVALATDGSVFYYGALSVDAQDVTHNLRVFPEAIRAAFADIAFGQNAYYDAHTGSGISNLGFYGSVYGLNPSGGDFWVYDAGAERLRHLAPRTSASGADAGAP